MLFKHLEQKCKGVIKLKVDKKIKVIEASAKLIAAVAALIASIAGLLALIVK